MCIGVIFSYSVQDPSVRIHWERYWQRRPEASVRTFANEESNGKNLTYFLPILSNSTLIQPNAANNKINEIWENWLRRNVYLHRFGSNLLGRNFLISNRPLFFQPHPAFLYFELWR